MANKFYSKYSAEKIEGLFDKGENKPFFIWHDETAGVYRFFPDEEKFDVWYQHYYVDQDIDEFPEIVAYQFVDPVTAPAPYTINISVDDIKYILEGTTGITLDFTFETRDGNEQKYNESVDVYYTFRSPTSIKTASAVYSGGEDGRVSMNVDKYISLGTNNITITVRGRSTKASKTVIATFYVIKLSLSSSFNIATSYNTSQRSLNVGFTSDCDKDRTTYFYIDGIYVNNYTITSLEPGPQTKIMQLPMPETAGKHTLQLYSEMSINNVTYKSDLLYYEFVVEGLSLDLTTTLIQSVFPSTTTPYILPRLPGLTGEQYVIKEIDWAYYSSNYQLKQTTIQWRLYVGGTDDTEGVETPIATRTADVVAAENGTPPEPLRFMPTEVGEYHLQGLITTTDNHGEPVTEIIGDYIITIIENTSGIIEATSGLTMKLSGLGRDNDEPEDIRNSWVSKIKNNIYTTEFFNQPWDGNSGWNDNALVLNNGATAIINNKPFSREINPTGTFGCTFEIDFETFNVYDENAEVLRISDSTNASKASLIITSNKAVLRSDLEGEEIISRFKADERVKLAFVIYPSNANTYARTVFVYNNGVISGVILYNNTDNFNIGSENDDSEDGMIKLGNEAGEIGVKIYSIRTYSNTISMYDELNNFFIDSGDNLQYLVKDNDIYSSSRLLDIDKLESTITTVEITGPLGGLINQGSGKHSATCALEIKNPDNSKINLSCENALITNAGQSTLDKPIPSLHVKLDKNGNICHDRDGNIIPKNRWAFREGNVPEKKFRLQANYMDSSCCHNGAFFRMFNEVAPKVQINGKYVLRIPAYDFAVSNSTGGYSYMMNQEYGSDPSGNGWKFPYTINMVPDSIPCIVVWREDNNSDFHFLGQYVLMEEKKAAYASGMHSIYSGLDKDGNPDPFGFNSTKSGEKLWDNINCHQMELLNSNDDLTQFLDYSRWDSLKSNGDYVREDSFELIYPDEDDLSPADIQNEWSKFFYDVVKPVIDSRGNYYNSYDEALSEVEDFTFEQRKQFIIDNKSIFLLDDVYNSVLNQIIGYTDDKLTKYIEDNKYIFFPDTDPENVTEEDINAFKGSHTLEEIATIVANYTNEESIIAMANTLSNTDLADRVAQESINSLLYGSNRKLDNWHFAAYYCIAMRNACSDSMARNMELVTYDGNIWLPKWWDVDMQCGLQQSGECNIEPMSDRNTKIAGTDSYAFSGRGEVDGVLRSTWLWDALEKSEKFMKDVKTMDEALYQAGWKYDQITKIQDNEYVDAWSKALYNESGISKYLGFNTAYYLYLQGDRTPHRHWFLRTSYDYFDALNICGEYMAKIISVRTLGISPPQTISFKAAITSYFGWTHTQTIGESGIRVEKGDVGYITINQSLGYNDPLHILGGNKISEIDLSPIATNLYANIDFSSTYDDQLGSQLRKIILGVPIERMNLGNFNRYSGAESISGTENFTKLEYLDIRGLQFLTSLDMFAMRSLREFYAAGSRITSFMPARGSKFLAVELPTTVTTISMSGGSLTDSEENCVIKWYDTIYESSANPNTGELESLPRRVEEVAIESDGYVYTVPSTLRKIELLQGMGKDLGAQKLVFEWLKSVDHFLGDDGMKILQLNSTNVEWRGVNVEDLLLLSKILRSNLNVTGRIICSGKLNGTQINSILNAFGENAFNVGNSLIIDAAPGVVLAAPTEILAGNEVTLKSISFPLLDNSGGTSVGSLVYSLWYFETIDNVETITPVTNLSVDDDGAYYMYKTTKLYQNTGRIITEESNESDYRIIAKVQNDYSGESDQAQILIKKRTYPQSIKFIVTSSTTGAIIKEDQDLNSFYVMSNDIILNITTQITPASINGTLQSESWTLSDNLNNFCTIQGNSENKPTLQLYIHNLSSSTNVTGTITNEKIYKGNTRRTKTVNFRFEVSDIVVNSSVNPQLQGWLDSNFNLEEHFRTFNHELLYVRNINSLLSAGNEYGSELQHLAELNHFKNLEMSVLDLSNCTQLGTLGYIQLEDRSYDFVNVFPRANQPLELDIQEINLSNTQYKGANIASGNTLQTISYSDYTTNVNLINQDALTEVNIPESCIDLLQNIIIEDCDILEGILWISSED